MAPVHHGRGAPVHPTVVHCSWPGGWPLPAAGGQPCREHPACWGFRHGPDQTCLPQSLQKANRNPRGLLFGFGNGVGADTGKPVPLNAKMQL